MDKEQKLAISLLRQALAEKINSTSLSDVECKLVLTSFDLSVIRVDKEIEELKITEPYPWD